LRSRNYVAVLFDFEKPHSKDITETLSLLAHMSHFMVADLTDAKSVPTELTHIVPVLPSVPVVPVLQGGEKPYPLFDDVIMSYSWVLEPFVFADLGELLSAVDDAIIARAETQINKNRTDKARLFEGTGETGLLEEGRNKSLQLRTKRRR
jgi:hypothetical protein